MPPCPLWRCPWFGGGVTDLAVVQPGASYKLVVVYRGAFCPFCQGTIADLKDKLGSLTDAGVDVLAVSADLEDVATAFVAEKGPLGCVCVGCVKWRCVHSWWPSSSEMLTLPTFPPKPSLPHPPPVTHLLPSPPPPCV